MSFLSLMLLAFQLPGRNLPVAASDTVFAQVALERALHELAQAKPPFGSNRLSWRVRQQSEYWGRSEQMWRGARRVDSVSYQGDQQGWYYTSNLLYLLYQRTEMPELRRRTKELPAQAQKIVIDNLAGMLECGEGRELSLQLASDLSRRERARVLAQVARPQLSRPCRSTLDAAESRRLLRSAVSVTTGERTRETAGEVRSWLLELHKLGGRVSDGELVRMSRREMGGGPLGELRAAEALIEAGRRNAAEPLLDEVYRVALKTRPRPYDLLAHVHSLRGTTRDQALARSYYDSARARLPVTTPSLPAGNVSWTYAHNALADVVSKKDVRALAATLRAVQRAGQMPRALFSTTEYLRFRTEPRKGPFASITTKTALDSAVRFAGRYFDGAWTVTQTLPAVSRDSVRVALVELLSTFNRPRAWDIARTGLQLPRFRERAMAHTLTRWARTDAMLAAREAAGLQDEIARNIIYLELTQRAVEAGRLSEAAAFADRTVDGKARVHSQYLVAREQFETGSTEAARARVRTNLDYLDAISACSAFECCFTSDPPMPGVEYGILPPGLIFDVITLAWRAGLRSELVAWAGTRKKAEERAAAWVALVESFSERRLGRGPTHPTY